MVVDADALRASFTPRAGICVDCKVLPKAKPRHRCEWCQLRKLGTDAEVSAALTRSESPEPSDHPTLPEGCYCLDCSSWVPSFYMSTKSRCRGCHLARSRSRRDEKTYGLAPGTRQEWYEAQGGKCWGCRKAQRFTGLAMHHDHKTGKPYYLACSRCNQAMGDMNDDPVVLFRLALGMMFPPHESEHNRAIHIQFMGSLMTWLDS